MNNSQHIVISVFLLSIVFFFYPHQLISQEKTIQTFLVLYTNRALNPADSAQQYSLFVGWPVSNDERNEIAVLAPKTIFLHYKNMIDVEKGVTPWAADILNNHPDFLLKTIGGTKNLNEDFTQKYVWGYLNPHDSTNAHRNRFTLDPRSDGWAKYYSQLVQKDFSTWSGVSRHGVFVDNVWPYYVYFFQKLLSMFQVDMNGDGIMDTKDDLIWADAMIQFSVRVKGELGNSNILLANFGTSWEQGSNAKHILEQGKFDGAMDEEFVHFSLNSDPNSFPAFKKWKENVSSLMIADSLGKIALAQSLGKEDDYQARLFCLGSFLLGEGKTCYFNYRYVNSYIIYFRFPEFGIDIGSSLETFHRVEEALDTSTHLYRRVFSHGMVFVNPGAIPITVTLPPGSAVLQLVGGCIANGGNVVWSKQQNITVAASSAAIIKTKNLDYQ